MSDPYNTYQPGDYPRLQGVFTDVNGDLKNPDIVDLIVVDPNGVSYNYTKADMTNPSTGTFYLRFFIPNVLDEWWWSMFGSGTVIAFEQRKFLVEARQT